MVAHRGVGMAVWRQVGLFLVLFWSGAVWAGPMMVHPEVSLGSNPIRNFSDRVAVGESRFVLSVPDGQQFVMTTFMENVESLELKKDGVVRLDEWTLSQSYFRQGTARIPIPAGTVVEVHNTGRNGPDPQLFYIEGYFTAENDIHRYWTGLTAGAALTEVFTNTEDSPFLVRTIVLGSWQCAVYINDDMVLDMQFLMDTKNAFQHGRGKMLVPSGATVQIASPVGANCEYLIEGDFIRP
jgi:hypothetical protein